MEILTGVVSKLRTTVEISGGGKNSDVTTTHITIFQLDGQPVKIKSRETVLVDEGDHVAIAGKVNNRTFNAYAYINNTTGVSGNIGMGIHYTFGVVLPVAGVIFINSVSSSLIGSVPNIIATVFIGVGMYMFYKGTQISKASRLLAKR